MIMNISSYNIDTFSRTCYSSLAVIQIRPLLRGLKRENTDPRLWGRGEK